MPYNFNNNSSVNTSTNTNVNSNSNTNAYKQASYDLGLNNSFKINSQINAWNQKHNNGFQPIDVSKIKLSPIDYNASWYNPNQTSFNNGMTFNDRFTNTVVGNAQLYSNNQNGVQTNTNNQNANVNSNEGDDEKDNGDGTGGAPGSGFSIDKLAGGVGTAITGATMAFGKQYDDEGFQIEKNISSLAANPIFGPWGAVASGMSSLSSQVTREADIDTKHMTERARKAAGVSKGAQIGNNIMSWLNNTTFGASWTSFTGIPIWGTSANMDKTAQYAMSREANDLSGAYSGTTSEMRAGEDAADGRFYFGKQKLSDLVNRSIKNDHLLQQIGIDNEQRVSSVPYNADLIAARNFNKLNGATYQGYGTRVGKQGMKMLSREELDKIYAAKKVETDITKLQNGGSILVPDGVLHAHKHHMEDVNPELAEDLTKKGIPVVAVDEEGEVIQVAEIEKEELIFEKSLTEEVERLWKDGSEEAMIEAGKLITKTLMTNCDDNAGLVKEVE